MGTHDDEKAVPSPSNGSLHGDHGQRVAGKDQDIAIAIVGEHRQDIDPVLEARVVRKIDWFLIPTMIFGYGLVYYDKVISSSVVLLLQLLTCGIGYPRLCCPLRHDERPEALGC